MQISFLQVILTLHHSISLIDCIRVESSPFFGKFVVNSTLGKLESSIANKLIFPYNSHPIDRLVSKFYYLQTATWENTYRPEWKDLSLLEWATSHNADENHMVKKILGKKLNDEAGLTDLIAAKEIIRHKFFVGKMDDMEESIKRFNIVMGVDNSAEKTKQCIKEYFGKDEVAEVSDASTELSEEDRRKAADNKNSHSHPKASKGSIASCIICQSN